MSKLKTVLLVVVLLMNTALAGGALYLANLSKVVDYGGTGDALGDGDITEVAGYAPDVAAGDVAVALSAMQRGGNFRVDFTAGKQTSFGVEEHEGTWDELSGALVYRPETQELVAIEVAFAVTSLRTDAVPLTNTVLSKEKWFDYENHPTAVFECDTVLPITAGSGQGAETHTLDGRFTLNGITHDISIPATLGFAGQTLTLDASFELLRSDYDMDKREGSLAGAAGDMVSQVNDAVEMRVRMTVSPDPSAVIAELAAVVEAQRVQIDGITGVLAQMEQRMRSVEAGGGAAATSGENLSSADTAGLPAQFTDFAPVYAKVKLPDGEDGPGVIAYAPFDMVLVPGDDINGVAPLYLSRFEVTWSMLEAWSYSRDVGDVEEIKQLIGQGLRPTPLYGDPSVLVQMDVAANPARAMSRKTCESFCEWLSEKTGRRYRLPTEAEWEHAFLAGGGMPDDLDASAWHLGNTPRDEYGEILAIPNAGTRTPNALGIHDMLGSVSEWVVPSDRAERALRGGNVKTPADELVFAWRAAEDPVAWFAAYPNTPHSLFWYPSNEFGGLRLVCEAGSVVENPPTGIAPTE